ncbi:MAG: DNA adenine methylase [Nannocystaceae bacterium]|nr:DNA adenine methylase [Myxococcales bacterium]
MIKYLGSKRTLIPRILEVVAAVDAAIGVRTVVDLFSGTSRVGHALKRAGYRVLANDHNAYARVLAGCYVAADREDVADDAARLVAELNRLPGAPGYFTEVFCEQARFFQARNGARVDAIREAIAHKELPPALEAVLLTSLMEAADRVDSTTGVHMAYLKRWAPRAENDLELRVPEVLPRARRGPGAAFELDALVAAAALSGELAYLDPPYNQHKYLGNYHIWETLVRWDQPSTYGVARKRVDCKERRSPFNSRRAIAGALAAVLARLDARALIVSFSNEGFLSRHDLESMLQERGEVTVLEHDYRRYVGAQIGVFNPRGERVGEVSHLRNKELLYVVGPPAVTRALERLAAEPRGDA